MRTRNFLGLPDLGLNLILGGLGLSASLISLHVLRGGGLTWQGAKNLVIVGDTASELEELSGRLQEQAEIMKKKDAAYRDLERTLDDMSINRKGNSELVDKLEVVENLPDVSNINEITADIQKAEEDLLEISE